MIILFNYTKIMSPEIWERYLIWITLAFFYKINVKHLEKKVLSTIRNLAFLLLKWDIWILFRVLELKWRYKKYK